MQGSRQLAATQEQAWAALNDPEVLKQCIRGCDQILATSPEQFQIAMAVRVGPVAARFTGKILLSDIQAPSCYTLTFEGQGGSAGFGKGAAKVRLVAEATGGCQLVYSVQAQVGGKLAQVGQRLVDGVAKAMAEDFFKKFDEELLRRHPPTIDMPFASPRISPAESARKLPSHWLWWALGGGLLALGIAMAVT